ncbi:MAG: hypothetical protein KAI24_20610, partial [Planctomycetes bacterium]|nr:hypothetical protein [Planctomycetota bacterium]
QDGDVYTVDGGTESDTIDLSEFGSGTVEDDGASIAVDLGDGKSFTINYTNIETVVTADTAGNHGPDADAGPDQPHVMTNVDVDLDGSRSDDFDGDALTYKWTQIGGPSVSLSDPTIVNPSFTSPNVTTPTTLTFSLEVSDGTTSHVDTIEVRVLPTVRGGLFSDTLTGTSQDEFFLGLTGDDTITAGAGDDVLAGGGNSDTLDGGDGHDIVNYSDDIGGVIVDITLETPQATGSGDDTLISIEGVIGSTYDDTFAFSSPVAGATYTVDGNTGVNTVDLSTFASTAVTFGDGRMTIDMGGGQSFTIDHARVDSVVFSDLTATVLSDDVTLAGFSGSGLWIDGDEAFRIDMSGGGTVDLAYDKGSDSLSITGSTGAGVASSLSITDLNGTDLRVTDIVLDADFGDLTTNTGVGSIRLAGDWHDINGTFTIGGDLGSIDVYEIKGTLDVQGDADTILVRRDVLDGGAIQVSGDVGTLQIDDDVAGSISIDGNVTLLDLSGLDGSDGDIAATGSIVVGGDVATMHVDRDVSGPVSIDGDVGTLVVDRNVNADITILGDLDSASMLAVGPAATVTAEQVSGTLAFVVGGTDHGGSYGAKTVFAFDGATASAIETPWIYGTAGADTLTGTAGDDHFEALAGDDTITGGAGDDTMFGGAGNDTVSYSDATGPVTVDVTLTNAQDTGGGGVDRLVGIEGVIGSSYDDTFRLAAPEDGAVYTIDGGGGSNTLDLSGFASSAVTFGDGTMTVDLGGGQSFTVAFSAVQTIVLADITATAVVGSLAQSGFSGSHIWIDGNQTFRLDVAGAGTVSLAYDAASQSFAITDTTATNATTAVTISTLSGTGVAVDVTVDDDLASLTSDADIGSLTLGMNSSIDVVTVGDGAGSIASVAYTPAGITTPVTYNANIGDLTMADSVAADLTVNGDLGSITVNKIGTGATVSVSGDLGAATFLSSSGPGALSVGGDLTSLTANNDLESVIDVAGSVGSMTVAANSTATITIGGDLDSATFASTTAGSVTAQEVVGTLVFDVGGVDHGGTYSATTVFTYDGALGSATATTWIFGTAGADVLTGTSGDDLIDGLGGDDTIAAGAGDDRIVGGDG